MKTENSRFLITTFVTLAVAFTGYFYTWTSERSNAQYQARLERVNKQLSDFYGPMYGLLEAENESFQQFFAQTRPEAQYFWSSANPPSEDQAIAWRRWIKVSTMPLYEQMQKIVITHSDLIVEPVMPPELIKLSAHIEGYRAVIQGWDSGDYSRNTSFYNFPSDVRNYAKKHYEALKIEQAQLLGLIADDKH